MKKRAQKSLTTLARIKDAEERAAAERLTAARERLDQERKNLTTVRQYLSDYSTTRVTVFQSRMLAENQRFRLRLEQTATAQLAAVERAERHAEAARAHWATVRAEREAMSKLVDRRREASEHRERKLEQQQSDEQALQQSTRQEGNGPAA